MALNEPSGLLSKVVKFVRNPTTNWSDLDQPELDKESQYSKQMLKEMIERKRRNDFVRKREFDQLRKMRQREAQAPNGVMEKPSGFQSSIPSRLQDDRASTIKKIDEIEEQMSKQWWRAKEAGSAAKPVRLSPRASLLSDTSELDRSQPFPATVPASELPLMDSRVRANAYAPTDVSPLRAAPQDAHPPENEPVLDMLAALDASINLGIALPEAQSAVAPDTASFAHDPELDEAAVRFANGDLKGAEASLVALLNRAPAADGSFEVWMTLFDLYQATDQQERFDTAAIDFATRFGRSAPAWFSIPGQTGQTATAALAVGVAGDNGLGWTCPSVLNAAAVAGLQNSMQRSAAPSAHMDWSNLGSIDLAAVGALAAVVSGWAHQALQLTFVDGDRLENVVKSQTRAGDASVEAAWWQLRLDLLRIMQRHDAFDMVALEYCITYEVSPPSWQDVRCSYKSQDVLLEGGGYVSTFSSTSAGGSEFRDSDAGPHLAHGVSTPSVSMGSLAGLVLGDASEALAAVASRVENAPLLVVSCDHLMRIDFSAAGSVLNWAAAQQSADRQVHFTGLHRLVAIFFNVIGINEYAKVFVRRN